MDENARVCWETHRLHLVVLRGACMQLSRVLSGSQKHASEVAAEGEPDARQLCDTVTAAASGCDMEGKRAAGGGGCCWQGIVTLPVAFTASLLTERGPAVGYLSSLIRFHDGSPWYLHTVSAAVASGVSQSDRRTSDHQQAAVARVCSGAYGTRSPMT